MRGQSSLLVPLSPVGETLISASDHFVWLAMRVKALGGAYRRDLDVGALNLCPPSLSSPPHIPSGMLIIRTDSRNARSEALEAPSVFKLPTSTTRDVQALPNVG
jgi:hypothetical protein